jgi:hypothetical protein
VLWLVCKVLVILLRGYSYTPNRDVLNVWTFCIFLDCSNHYRYSVIIIYLFISE